MTDFQHTCNKIQSLSEVTLGMKSNLHDKLPETNNEIIPTIIEQISDFETSKSLWLLKNSKFLYIKCLLKIQKSPLIPYH